MYRDILVVYDNFMTGRSSKARRRTAFTGSRRVSAFVCGVTVVLIVTGCGGSSITLGGAHHTSKTQVSTSIGAGPGLSNTSLPDNVQERAILAAYEGSVRDFDEVATKLPVESSDPILADHMAGDKLRTVSASLLKLAENGQLNTGSLTSLWARVTQEGEVEAVVESCELDGMAIENVAPRQVIIPAKNSTELVNELVQLKGGVWKVVRGSQVHEGCS